MTEGTARTFRILSATETDVVSLGQSRDDVRGTLGDFRTFRRTPDSEEADQFVDSGAMATSASKVVPSPRRRVSRSLSCTATSPTSARSTSPCWSATAPTSDRSPARSRPRGRWRHGCGR